MRTRATGATVLVLWLIGAAGVAVAFVLAPRNGDATMFADQGLGGYLLLAVFLGVGVMGAIIAWRRPDNLVGWLFLANFVLLGALVGAQEHATYALGVAPGSLPGGVLAAWIAGWAWYPAIGILFVYVPLLFPTGHPPSRRWTLVGWTGGVALATVTVHSALAERLANDVYSVANPVGVPGVVAEQGFIDAVAFAVLSLAVVGAVASLVVRFRRSRGDERQQLKWFTFAAALLPVLILLDIVGAPLPAPLADAVFAIVLGFLPVATAIAILRYRLYDIDRLISRTVSYAALSALLVAVYVVGVMLLGRLLAPLTSGSELAVAGATLGAAALFAPARRGIQQAVDRRFNRARYDAEQVVARFRVRLRDEVDLDQLGGELRATVRATVQPTAVRLWLRTQEGPR